VLREVFRDAARFAADPAGFADQLRAALRAPGALLDAGQALAAQYTWDAAAAAHLDFYGAWGARDGQSSNPRVEPNSGHIRLPG
jgi:hypothetical protein